LISSWKLLTSKGAQGPIMRKTLLGKFVGVLLAFLAVGSMTLLQVDPTYAAAQVQTALSRRA
jgi:hypothetical protein